MCARVKPPCASSAYSAPQWAALTPIHTSPAYPQMTPLGMAYVDHTHGIVRSLSNAGGSPPSPSTSPLPAYASIIASSVSTVGSIASTWTPGVGNQTFWAESNVEGREGRCVRGRERVLRRWSWGDHSTQAPTPTHPSTASSSGRRRCC